MLEQFKEDLKKLESKIGKYKSITAVVQDGWASKVDNSTFTESIVYVELEEGYIILAYLVGKWGDMFSMTKFSLTKPEDSDEIWVLPNYTVVDLEEEMEYDDFGIWELAQEIYNESYIFIVRTIDINDVTSKDIKYLVKSLWEALKLKYKLK